MIINDKQKRLTIGMLIVRLEEEYQSQIWPAVAEAAEELGVNVIFFIGYCPGAFDNYNFQRNLVYELIDPYRLDGLILLSSSLGNFVGYEELHKMFSGFIPLPMVSIGIDFEDIPSIIVDDSTGVRDAVEHLIFEHDIKDIAYIRGPVGHEQADNRFNAYKQTLEKHDIGYNPEYVYTGNFFYQEGIKAVNHLFIEKKIECQAIVAANDDMALGAFTRLKELKYRIPNDITIIGFDNNIESEVRTPALTTVMQSQYEQGRKAFELLIKIIKKEPAPHRIALPTRLIIRQSCGCPVSSVRSISNKVIIENTGITHYTPLEDLKQNIYNKYNELLQKTRIKDPLGTELIGDLVDLLLDDMQSKNNNDSFMNKLNEIMIDSIYNIHFFNLIQPLLTIMYNETVAAINDRQQLLVVEHIFHKMQVLVFEFVLKKRRLHAMQQQALDDQYKEMAQEIVTKFNLTDLLEFISHELPKLNFNCCMIANYQEKLIAKNNKPVALPEKSRTILAFENGQNIKTDKINSVFESKHLFPDGILDPGKQYSLILLPLFFREEQLGFMLIDIGTEQYNMYELLRGQISSSLKGSLLMDQQKETYGKLQKALREVELANTKLQDLSIRDELTGLYNRRGFFKLAEQHVSTTARKQETFLILFIDLDNLKQINDTYGHTEGDDAIKAMSKILNETARHSDIVARLGGDEFIILASDTKLIHASPIEERLVRYIDTYNKKSEKEYKLNMSMGHALFDHNTIASLDDAINAADSMLYQIKRKKKKTKSQ